MDSVIGPASTAGGIVWLPVSVGGRTVDMGAAIPGEWHLSLHSTFIGHIAKARALSQAWERAHPDEAAKLFAEASAFRQSRKRP